MSRLSAGGGALGGATAAAVTASGLGCTLIIVVSRGAGWRAWSDGGLTIAGAPCAHAEMSGTISAAPIRNVKAMRDIEPSPGLSLHALATVRSYLRLNYPRALSIERHAY